MMQPATGKILIVDDEPSVLKMMSVFLTRLGFAVEAAGRTDDAWAIMQAAPTAFSIALLDATMPGMTMEDLAARLLGANPQLRVLAASGYPVDVRRLEAAAPGRVSFLHKPFTPEMLASAVRRLLGAQTKI